MSSNPNTTTTSKTTTTSATPTMSSNPNTSTTTTVSSPPDPKSSLREPPIQPQPNVTQNDAESESKVESEAGHNEDVEEEEEEGECGFCVFMKGGGCKDVFIAWENCVEQGEKNNEDIVEKCFEATAALKKCMEAHSEYYEPILRAEKTAEQEVAKEKLNEPEKDKNNNEQEVNLTIEVPQEGGVETRGGSEPGANW